MKVSMREEFSSVLGEDRALIIHGGGIKFKSGTRGTRGNSYIFVVKHLVGGCVFKSEIFHLN